MDRPAVAADIDAAAVVSDETIGNGNPFFLRRCCCSICNRTSAHYRFLRSTHHWARKSNRSARACEDDATPGSLPVSSFFRECLTCYEFWIQRRTSQTWDRASPRAVFAWTDRATAPSCFPQGSCILRISLRPTKTSFCQKVAATKVEAKAGCMLGYPTPHEHPLWSFYSVQELAATIKRTR